MADARGQHADADLAGARLGELEGLDRGRARRSPRRTAARTACSCLARPRRRSTVRGRASTGRRPATTSRHRSAASTSVVGVDPGQARVDRLAATAIAIARDTVRRSRPAGRAPRSRAASSVTGVGQRPGGQQEHPVGDGPRLGRDRAEPEAREDEDVVGLADLVAAPVDLDRRRTASRSRPAPGRRSSARTSAGVASAAEVGFDSGRMIGRGRARRHGPDDAPR